MKKLLLLSLVVLSACKPVSRAIVSDSIAHTSIHSSTTPLRESTTHQTTLSTSTKPLKQYFSKDKSYSIWAPNDWIDYTNNANSDIVLLYAKDITAISFKATSKDSLNLQQFAEIAFPNYANILDATSEELTYSNTTIAGYTAITSQFKALDDDNDEQIVHVYAVETDSKFILIASVHYKENYSELNLNKTLLILNSLQFE